MFTTLFDQPTIKLLPDETGPRFYANVDNRIEVVRGRDTYRVAVAVPTEFFTLMKEVCDITPDEEVTLAIDQDGEHYVFSLLAGQRLFDLWRYSERSLPVWITDRAYRC